MSPKSTLWLVLVTAGLFGYIFFFEWRTPSPEELAADVKKLFPDFDPKKVTSVEIIRSNSNTIRADRTNGQWQLTLPVVYPAQSTAIENWVELFTRLNRRAWISAQEILAQKGALASFGLDEPRANVTIQHGGERIQMRLGEKTAVGEKLYLQIVGSDGVYVTESLLMDRLPQSAVDWRDPQFLNLAGLNFDRFQIRAGAREFVLQRDATNRLWRLTTPRPARADNARIDQLFQELQTVRVSRFVSDVAAADLEPYGLHSPELTVTFGQGTNNLLVVDFGKPLTNNSALVFARRGSYPNIVAVPRRIADTLRAPYTEFLDRHLIEFAPESVTRIEVRADETFALQKQINGGWRVVEPQTFPADAQLVRDFLKRLNSLQIVEPEKDVVTDSDLPNYGLLPPIRQYLLKTGDHTGETNRLVAQIDFGTNRNDRVFVRRVDESSVYKVGLEESGALPRAAFELRDRRIWNFATNQVRSLTIALNDQSFKLERDTNGKWRITAGQGIVNSFALEEAIYRLGQLSAKAWVTRGDKDLSRYGFTEAAHKLSIELGNGDKSEVVAVEFGAPLSPSGGPYAAVQLEWGRTVFEFPADVFIVYNEVVRSLTATSGIKR